MIKLEVIAFNISCCKEIEIAGAHRIELCANPHDGGTTPSAGFIVAARKAVSISLFPIIRPRGGDFYYSKEEFEIIKADVLFCKNAGCDGVVTGMLLKNGRVDKERVNEIVNLARPMVVTFHRAFDRSADPFEALEDIIETGCVRILSSGQQSTAGQGSELIRQLVQRAAGRIVIMPGSGIRSSNIHEIAALTGAVEFHSSARKTIVSKMENQKPAQTDLQSNVVVDTNEVSAMLKVLDGLNNVNA